MIDETLSQEAAEHKTNGISISERKLKANRENARKSTGPKTLIGKAFSRRNALKHGLFTRQFMDFVEHKEDPAEYAELLNGLRDDYRPVGRAEELDVERIALCWWKLQRASRHENAMNRVALRTLGLRDLQEKAEFCKTRDEQERAAIILLQSAQKEIEVTGEISQELKQKIFAAEPILEERWSSIEDNVKELLNLSHFSAVAQNTVTVAIKFIEQLAKMRQASFEEIAAAQHIIPKGESLDRLLRYETTIDRSLNRSLDRLERLQRHRSSERIRQETDRIQ